MDLIKTIFKTVVWGRNRHHRYIRYCDCPHRLRIVLA